MSSHTNEIFEFNKMLVIYDSVTLIIGLWLISIIITGRKVIIHRFFLLFLLFLVVLGISTLKSIDIHTSIFGYYGRFNGGLLSIFAYALLSFVFYNTFDQFKTHTLLFLSYCTSVIVTMWGMLSHFGFDLTCQLFAGNAFINCWSEQFNPQKRIFSTLGQPNWLAAYVVIHAFIGIYLLLKKSKYINLSTFLRSKRTLLYFISIALLVWALILTGSRSGELAFIFGFGVAVALYLHYIYRKKKPARFIFVGSVIGLVFITIFIVYRAATAPIDQNITDSLTIRTIVWEGAIKLADMYPLFGTGPETFGYAYYFTRPARHNLTSEWDFLYNKAHNEFLNQLATTGYVGFIAYLAIISGTFFLLHRVLQQSGKHDEQKLLITLTSAYLSILVTNFYGFSTTTIQLFFYLIPAMVLVLFRQDQEEPNVVKKKFLALRVATSLAVCVLTAFLLSRTVAYYKGDMLFKRGNEELAQNNYGSAVSLFEKALSYKEEHVYEDKLSSAYAYAALVTTTPADSQLSANLIDRSKQYLSLILKQSPKNILYWRTSAENYFIYYQLTHDENDLKQALFASDVIVELAPTDAKSFYNGAALYQYAYNETGNEKYRQNMMELVKKGLRLKPHYLELQQFVDEG